MLNNVPDGELVSMYVSDKNESAFRELVSRHHDRLYSRFLTESKNVADARDLEQQLWLQVTRHLKDYRDEGKFAHFLSRIASNLIKDFWRGKNRRSDVFVESRATGASCGSDDHAELSDVRNYRDDTPDGEQKLMTEELVTYLVTVLVPQLPPEQRTAWLLRHESEFWEPGRRLDWNHLADLNGMDDADVWRIFESARNKLMNKANDAALNEEETLVFLVWSQAQRLNKDQRYTWEYFSELLGVPVNTMKTRYRTAQKQLDEGLRARMAD